MKPFGMRYWEYYDFHISKEEFLEYHSLKACSWIRDQEYLVDFKYYENLYHSGHGYSENYLHIFPKVRLVSFLTCLVERYKFSRLLTLLRDPPPQNETWTNRVCRPGNSTYTVVNANCYQGICQCNPGYIASLEKDFCHYCPSPKAWNHFTQTCEDENEHATDCDPFSFTCTRNDLTVSIFYKCHLDKG